MVVDAAGFFVTRTKSAAESAERPTGRLSNDETPERFRQVMPAVDTPNKKYGRDTTKLAEGVLIQ